MPELLPTLGPIHTIINEGRRQMYAYLSQIDSRTPGTTELAVNVARLAHLTDDQLVQQGFPLPDVLHIKQTLDDPTGEFFRIVIMALKTATDRAAEPLTPPPEDENITNPIIF